MLAISIVLFVVPDNSYLVMFQHYFTCRVSLFRNQNLNIQKKTSRCAVTTGILYDSFNACTILLTLSM